MYNIAVVLTVIICCFGAGCLIAKIVQLLRLTAAEKRNSKDGDRRV